MTIPTILRSSRAGATLLLIFMAAVVSVNGMLSRPAAAACTAPSTQYGTATMKLTVATAGDYRLWTRMKAPDTTNNSYLLGVDGNACITVGDAKTTAGAWTWVDYRDGTTSSKVNVTLSAGTHTLTLIGREPSVMIDRVLAVGDKNCVPSGLGDNCMAKADSTKPVTTITMPEDLSTIKGTTSIKVDATDNANVAKVEFYVQGVLKATDTSRPYEYSWDTTKVADGTYTISAKAYDEAGNSSMDARSVTVKNKVVQPPSAPTNLSGKATTTPSVSLQWTAAKTAGGSALRYRVIRDGVTLATVNTAHYTDATVAAGKKYTYRVMTVDADGNVSADGPSVTVDVPALPVKDTTPPTKPTGLTASAAGTRQVNLSWKKSIDNAGAVTYDIYRAKGSDKAAKIASTGALSYGDTGLSEGTSYTYHVVARDAAGNQSQSSDKKSVTTARTVTPPKRTSTIRGTVKGKNGRPVAGAKVTVWVDGKRRQATTNWRGQYYLAKLPAGAYEVKIKSRTYATKTTTVKVSAGKTKWYDALLRR